MKRFLIVTWDGAGNLVPTLALAGRLARSGHDVRLLGHRSVETRCGSHGWTFRAFERTPDFGSAAPADDGKDMDAVAGQLWFNGSVARDVQNELSREPADVLIADCMLMGALAAGHAARVPTVALFHGAYALFRRGPLFDTLSRFLPALNACLDSLALPRVAAISEMHDRCAMSLVAAPKEFEPAIPHHANVRFAGPMLDAPPLLQSMDDVAPGQDAQPAIVVGFSTSQQGQAPVLRRIVAALASVPARAVVTTGPAIDPVSVPSTPNVQVVRFVPHARLLPGAALTITHAGLGTVMNALAHGVPMLCIPLGRDQFFNAARVEALGAGRSIAADATVDVISGAVRSLLKDASARASAERMAAVIAGYEGGAAALAEIVGLANRSRMRAPAAVSV
jgi:MGT family glycosyltransferase